MQFFFYNKVFRRQRAFFPPLLRELHFVACSVVCTDRTFGRLEGICTLFWDRMSCFGHTRPPTLHYTMMPWPRVFRAFAELDHVFCVIP